LFRPILDKQQFFHSTCLRRSSKTEREVIVNSCGLLFESEYKLKTVAFWVRVWLSTATEIYTYPHTQPHILTHTQYISTLFSHCMSRAILRVI